MMRPKKGLEFGIPDPPRAAPGEPEYEYAYVVFPTVLYRDEPDAETGLPYITIEAANEAQKQALIGEGWVDTPAKFLASKPVAAKKAKVLV
jgi:hypothetical protein